LEQQTKTIMLALLATIIIVALAAWYLMNIRWTNKKQPPMITGFGSIPIISPLIAMGTNPRSIFQYCSKKYENEGAARISIFGMVNVHVFYGLQFLETFFKLPENTLSLTAATSAAVKPIIGEIKIDHSTLHEMSSKQASEQKDWIRDSITKPDQLEYFSSKALKVVNRHMQKLRDNKVKSIDLFKEIYNIVIAVNIDCFVGDVDEFRQELIDLLWVIEYHGASIHSLFNPFSESRKKTVAARLRIVEIIDKLRERRMKKMSEDNTDIGRDVLQVNIDNGKTNEQIVQSLIGIFFAAQTNTVSTTCWTLAYLSQYPEWQEKVREEVLRIVPDDESISFANLREMDILGCCTSETVRKNALAFLFRKALKDITIGEYTILKGDYVIVSPSITHANPKVFPEPEKWKPERFLADGDYKSAALKLGRNFIQWGFQHHRCLGEHFATMVMRTTIAKFLREYKVDVDTIQELDFTKALGMPFAKGVMNLSLTPLESK
jgi:cytochrome P450